VSRAARGHLLSGQKPADYDTRSRRRSLRKAAFTTQDCQPRHPRLPGSSTPPLAKSPRHGCE